MVLGRTISTYPSPVRVICGNVLVFRQFEDTLLEYKLRVRRSHGSCFKATLPKLNILLMPEFDVSKERDDCIDPDSK